MVWDLVNLVSHLGFTQQGQAGDPARATPTLPTSGDREGQLQDKATLYSTLDI